MFENIGQSIKSSQHWWLALLVVAVAYLVYYQVERDEYEGMTGAQLALRSQVQDNPSVGGYARSTILHNSVPDHALNSVVSKS